MSTGKFIKTTILDFVNENQTHNSLDDRLKCVQNTLRSELKKYPTGDDVWVLIRQEIRNIDGYFEDGYFLIGQKEYRNRLSEFLEGLDYSDKYTYKKGEKAGVLRNTGIPYYKAEGDKVLFRGVSSEDWKRIQKQGFINSDMRGTIVETEGINLGQIPSTASYYLPHGKEGVILAISPEKLDLYMLNDEYIRVFEPIPLENVVKVSDIFIKNDQGGILTKDTDGIVNAVISRLEAAGIEVKC